MRTPPPTSRASGRSSPSFSLIHADDEPPPPLITNTDGSVAIPEGRVLIAGKPKVGKTFVAAEIVAQRLAADVGRIAVVIFGSGESAADDWTQKMNAVTRGWPAANAALALGRIFCVPWNMGDDRLAMLEWIEHYAVAGRLDLVIDSYTSISDDANSQADAKELVKQFGPIADAAHSTLLIGHEGHHAKRPAYSIAWQALVDQVYMLSGRGPDEDSGGDWSLVLTGSRTPGVVGSHITTTAIGDDGVVMTWQRPSTVGGDAHEDRVLDYLAEIAPETVSKNHLVHAVKGGTNQVKDAADALAKDQRVRIVQGVRGIEYGHIELSRDIDE